MRSAGAHWRAEGIDVFAPCQSPPVLTKTDARKLYPPWCPARSEDQPAQVTAASVESVAVWRPAGAP